MIAESLGDLVKPQIEVVATEVAKNATSEEAFDQAMDDYLLHQKNLLLLTTAGIMTALGQDVDTAIDVADNALTHNWKKMALALAAAAWQGTKEFVKDGVKKAAGNLGKKVGTKAAKPVNVEKLADKVAKNLGGVKTPAKGDGYMIRIPNGKKDIVVRIMEKGGERGTPYYRIGVDNKGSVTRAGKFNSTSPELTHFDIRPESLSDIIDIISKIKG